MLNIVWYSRLFQDRTLNNFAFCIFFLLMIEKLSSTFDSILKNKIYISEYFKTQSHFWHYWKFIRLENWKEKNFFGICSDYKLKICLLWLEQLKVTLDCHWTPEKSSIQFVDIQHDIVDTSAAWEHKNLCYTRTFPIFLSTGIKIAI